MELLRAITLSLGDLEDPVVTAYHLGLIVHALYARKEHQGEKVGRLQKSFATSTEYHQQLATLLDTGVLTRLSGCSAVVYTLLGRKADDPEEVACVIDPFCYLSHLSAMAHHGLTERIPSSIFVSSPHPKTWKLRAEERMQKDLGQELDAYKEHGMPVLTRLALEKISRRPVHRFASDQLGAYKNVQGRALRVSSLGRTFLDMLRNPELCGGMRHVVEVFEEHGGRYRQLIVNEIDLNGSKVDKVRAGYLLEEKLGIKDDATISRWVAHAARGGSRKLDPSAEYVPVWSEKWCLSLNL